MSVNVPNGYKQTKVGVIPEDWEVVRFNNVFERVTRKNTTNNTNVLTISAQYGLINQEDFFNKSVASKDLSGYILLKKGEFAYNKSYSSGYPMGAFKRLNFYDEGVLSSLYIYFKIKDDNSDFYEQYFEAGLMNKEIYKIAQEGARNHGLLNMSVKEFFHDILIIKPPLKEQQKIAQILTTWDKAISKQEALIAEKEQFKKGLQQLLLSGEVRFGEFDGEWEEVRLGDVSAFYKGKGISKNDIADDGIKCVRYGELYTKYGERIETVISKTFLPNKNLFLSKKNDILIPASGETAIDLATASCITKNDVAIGGDINIIRTKMNGIFLSYYLNTIAKKKIASLAQGVSVIHLYSKQLKSLKIKLPPLEEQQKIAQVLTTADKEIKLLKEELEALKEQKRGLMQKLLTGEVRVKI